jgi:flagellar hook-length control protein FliK
MAGLIPIQLVNPINRQAGLSAVSADDAEPDSNFAAVLAGHFPRGRGSETPSEAIQLSASEPLNTGNAPETLPLVAMPSSASALSNPVSGTKTTSRVTKKPDPTPNAPPVTGTAGNPNVTPVRQPGSPVAGNMTPPGDGAGMAPNALKGNGNVQSPSEDANPILAVLSEAALDATSVPLAAVPSGKNPNGGAGTHVKAHRLSAQHSVPVANAQVDQAVPVVVSTAVAPTSQPPFGAVSSPMVVPSPPGSANSAAAVPQLGVGGGDKPAEPNRSAAPDPGKAQQATPDLASVVAPPPPVFLTTAELQRLTDTSDAMPDTTALTAQADAPQMSSTETASPLPSPTGQAQPATPADQIAPVLVGILQKTDGQQSVTIRLQPAELGQVQIRIDQTVSGAAHISIIADRPETLQLLQRDEPRLQQTLDQAGVLSAGRTVSFQVAPAQVGATASRPDSMETGSGASGQGQNGGAWRQNGDSPNDFGRSRDPGQGQNRPRWFRAGLDITA